MSASASKTLNEYQTRNGNFFKDPQESSIYKQNFLSLCRFPSNPLSVSKQTSKSLLISSYKRNRSSEAHFDTNKDELHYRISDKKSSNGSTNSIRRFVKLPWIPLQKKKSKELRYIVNDLKVPEICIFHSKLIKDSQSQLVSPCSVSGVYMNSQQKKYDIEEDFNMNYVKKQLFDDDEDKDNCKSNGKEKGSNLPLSNSLFDSIYRNKKRMTNVIRQLLSKEISKAKQTINNGSSSQHVLNHSNPKQATLNSNNNNTSMSSCSFVPLLKRKYGLMTDIKPKSDPDNIIGFESANKMTLKKKKVEFNFFNIDTIKKQTTTNKLKISKNVSPLVMIRNDALVKDILSHNLSSMINLKDEGIIGQV